GRAGERPAAPTTPSAAGPPAPGPLPSRGAPSGGTPPPAIPPAGRGGLSSPRPRPPPPLPAGPHSGGSGAFWPTGPNALVPVARSNTWNFSVPITSTRPPAAVTPTRLPNTGADGTAHRPVSRSPNCTPPLP